ncbi:MAG: alcohol dehydrogenase [Hydrocarboniphaga sp.]|uniref:SDR family NAD(P)-dependent oxidoreductase n=1 Tax=Hydrocarboniphaga sp. TaxID=2033016 RepID=UPI002612BF0E|nr:SDR family NAD(P)-dependent oxidoreductase [Hydrocarboniphaga sp.]MDB5968640.1 alcohol dehydrogenase [Hydrocarboniphaga sp.]
MTGASAAFDLRGKLALVTGGGNGIGAGIAGVLAQAGASVVIADRDASAAGRTVEALQQQGHRAYAVAVDLAVEASVVKACAEVIAAHGTPWLLVNNAGLHDRELLLETTVGEWDRIMAVNARGPLLMTREIARAMVASGAGGRIVNIASNSARTPSVVGLASYASSKGALVALSLTSAFELVEHGITVNTVLPGGVVTPGAIGARGPATAGPGRRKPPLGMCEPQDIGAAVLFFASPAARHVTNQMLTVDAGASLT